MKNKKSRRSFLRNSAIAATGLSLLSSTQILKAATTVRSPYKGYNPYAPIATDMRRLSLSGKSIKVSGIVCKDLNIKSACSNATVEVWHLSPNSKKYNHCSKLFTDEQGRYSFITNTPNSEKGKLARIYFKVSHNGAVQYSELLLNSTGGLITGEHWEKNRELGEDVYPTSTVRSNQTNIKFNLSL